MDNLKSLLIDAVSAAVEGDVQALLIARTLLSSVPLSAQVGGQPQTH